MIAHEIIIFLGSSDLCLCVVIDMRQVVVMSFVFQIDPNEAEEGVKPTPAPGGRRATTPGESSGQRRSLIAKSLEPVKSVNHSGSDDEADDEDDKGPSR